MKKFTTALVLGLLMVKPTTIQPLTKQQKFVLGVFALISATSLGTSWYNWETCNGKTDCSVSAVNSATTTLVALLFVKYIYELLEAENRIKELEHNQENPNQQNP